MKSVMIAVAWLFAVLTAFAEQVPIGVKYFSGGISDVEYDSTNDYYVVRRRPTAKRFTYAYTEGCNEPRRIQPGETYILARGKKVHFTQHAGVDCELTFTNGVTGLNEVTLPDEFKNSCRQLLICGNYVVARDVFKTYSFVVNSEGDAYDVKSKSRFHFGIPFHAPDDKSDYRRDPFFEGVMRMQRALNDEGIVAYNVALTTLESEGMKYAVRQCETNAAPFVLQFGGAGTISEDVRNRLLRKNPDCSCLFRELDENMIKDFCVAFYTSENGSMRIVGIVKVHNGASCRFWGYAGSKVPVFSYLQNGDGATENYCEYGEDGCVRRYFLAKGKEITDYRMVSGGALVESSNMQDAHEFVARVDSMLKRCVELDATGTLKAFVENLNSKR